MENATVTCPYEGERDTRSLYLAGKLPDAEAQAFEEHFFTCGRCAEAVEVGSSLRAAFGKAPVRPAAAPERTSRTWLPLAAAAAVALGVFGLWQLARSPVSPAGDSVYRGGESRGTVVEVANAPDGGMTATWTSSPDASGYVVRVLSADGAEIWKTETVEPRVRIDAVALSSAGDKPLLLEVDTLDARQRVIATSGPTKLR